MHLPDKGANTPSSSASEPSERVRIFSFSKTVRRGRRPIASIRRHSPDSAPSSSITSSPIIWYPPQIPHTGTFRPASLRTAPSRPFWRIHKRSLMVFFVPGRITRSGVPSSDTFVTYRTVTPGILTNTSRSVKLEILGNRMTAISTSPFSL